MKVEIAFDLEEVRNLTFQAPFPETTICCRCGCSARLGFVAHELDNQTQCVCRLYANDPGGDGLWLHDGCAVAVYFCTTCLETTALYNQG